MVCSSSLSAATLREGPSDRLWGVTLPRWREAKALRLAFAPVAQAGLLHGRVHLSGGWIDFPS